MIFPSTRQPFRIARNVTRFMSSFKADDIHVTPTAHPAAKPEIASIQWGNQTSDHMLEVDYTPDHGWGRPHIRPVGPLSIHPFAKVLHYASEAFEGMKCYRCVDGQIRLFRPMDSANRLYKSAARTALPVFEQTELVKCIKRLVSVDQEWVPHAPQSSLYIRPVIIGTQSSLGVTASNSAKLFVITCPVGPYFPTGMKAVRLLADPSFVRAWPGGCGGYKMGSNYAPTILAHERAVAERGCQQCLWLFGEDEQMTEMGTMNLFVFWVNEQGEKELVTPPLESGLILPGITRTSLLDVAREWNDFKVTEEAIPMMKFIKAINEGRVIEVFGSGTAATVCPVRQIVYGDQELNITDGDGGGPLTQRIYNEFQDIVYYRKPTPWMDWMETIETDEPDSFRNAQ